MKTAMQELFSKLETEHPNLFNTNTQEGRKFINDYYQFFELEKKQIENAWIKGNYKSNADIVWKIVSSEQYYHKTFKL